MGKYISLKFSFQFSFSQGFIQKTENLFTSFISVLPPPPPSPQKRNKTNGGIKPSECIQMVFYGGGLFHQDLHEIKPSKKKKKQEEERMKEKRQEGPRRENVRHPLMKYEREKMKECVTVHLGKGGVGSRGERQGWRKGKRNDEENEKDRMGCCRGSKRLK